MNRHLILLTWALGGCASVTPLQTAQLLLDVAGYGERTLVCERGRARLVAGSADPGGLAAASTLGVCAWQPKR